MRPQIIVFDDDPTGSQTVHSCLLVLRWDVETLRQGLRDVAPIFFILANTRAMVEAQAIATTREICINLKTALQAEKIENFILVSRSDSTLRGHFPAETEAIAAEFGEFDACFHAPAFFEGGRITRAGNHYIAEENSLTPVHATEFAKDSVFGFKDSFLPRYIAEKTKGAIAAAEVEIIEPRATGNDFSVYLQALQHNRQVVINGETQADFDQIVPSLFAAVAQGKKFLFRSAASLLTSFASLAPQPIPAIAMGHYCHSSQPGIILVGSHVQKTSDQLTQLLNLETVQGVELDIYQCQPNGDRPQYLATISAKIQQIFQANKTPVLFTTRKFVAHTSSEQAIAYGQNISDSFNFVIRHLPTDIRFIISKGGNTTNALLRQALKLQTVRLLGQIMPGCCLVQTEATHPLFPKLPIVLFPGNVGDRHTLATVYHRLQKKT
ncbi:MAG: four-carbon acid sugar kinase family protein [Limnothrix sp. RL_2_0]|nr:four-carbon acid sugar kinase family protein [Limnothrix sp. RL_2_0]